MLGNLLSLSNEDQEILEIPETIRVSVGSAIVLNLTHGRLDVLPTTAYLLTYRSGKCSANCGFCPQAKTSKSRADMLSRVTWPAFPTERALSEIEDSVKRGTIKRVCIQALNYPTVLEDILNLVNAIRLRVRVPISVSCKPLKPTEIQKLMEAGVNRIGIPLDAATKELFNKVKGLMAGGPYLWEEQREALREAVKIFGKNRVSTHLIVGLGETEKEMVETIQWCVDSDVYPGLFAFTPVSGTALENQPQPSLSQYRRVQLAHYLVTKKLVRCENISSNESGCLTDFSVRTEQLWKVIRDGSPFVTSGCPDCNRPYYNERPSGPLYNYPRHPLPREITKIEKQFFLR